MTFAFQVDFDDLLKNPFPGLGVRVGDGPEHVRSARVSHQHQDQEELQGVQTDPHRSGCRGHRWRTPAGCEVKNLPEISKKSPKN